MRDPGRGKYDTTDIVNHHVLSPQNTTPHLFFFILILKRISSLHLFNLTDEDYVLVGKQKPMWKLTYVNTCILYYITLVLSHRILPPIKIFHKISEFNTNPPNLLSMGAYFKVKEYAQNPTSIFYYRNIVG